MTYLTQEELEFYQDFLTMTSDDSDFNVEMDMGDLVMTGSGEVKINPALNVDVEYNKEIAKQENNDEDLKKYNKALEKQQKENEKDLMLYNKALKKQQDKRKRIQQKRKETGLKLV